MSIASMFASAWRDYVTDGVPASGAQDPVKSEIRAIGAAIDTALGALSLGSVSVTKDTRAHLDADLAHAASSTALVYADATDANNDIYVKVGASGSGSWTLTNILHGVIAGLAQGQVDALVQPIADDAADSATLAGHFANDSTDTAVPGQGDSTARGAKYWAEQAAASAGDSEAVTANTAALTGFSDTVTTFGFGQSSGGLAQADTYTLLIHPAAPREAVLQYIDVTVKTVGTGASELVVYRPTLGPNTPNYFDAVALEVVSGIVATGNQRLLAGVHFPAGIRVPAGAYVGFHKAAGSVAFGYQGTGGTYTGFAPGTGATQLGTGLTYQLSATAGIADTQTVIAKTNLLDTSAAQTTLYQSQGWVTRKIGDQPVTGAATTLRQTLGSNGTTGYTGRLTGIEYFGMTAGDGIFEMWQGSGAVAADNVHVASWTATIVTGLATFTLPAEVAWTANSFLTWTGTSGAVATLNTIPGGFALNNRQWRNAAFFTQAAQPAFRPIIRTPATDYDVIASRLRGWVRKGSTSFPGTSTPSGWDAPVTMTVNDGLIPSGSPTMNSGALINGYSNADWRLATMQFIINATNIKMGIGTAPQFYAVGGYHGTDVLLDTTAGASSAVLRMYQRIGTNGGSYFDAGQSYAVPWTIATGRHFLTVQKKPLSITVTLADTVGHKVTWTVYIDGLSPVGRFKGKAGVVYRSGAASSFTVENFNLSHGISATPHCVFFGDSNLDLGGPAVMWDQGFRSYGRLLETQRGKGDILVCAAGGQTIAQATATIPYELAGLSPNHIVFDLLTNDLPNSRATIRTDLLAALTAIRTACPNAEIHLPTAKPFPAFQARLDDLNADIRTHYFETTLGIAPFRIVEVTKRLTTAHDDTAWNPLYVADSGAHASYAGEVVIADAYATDIPDLVFG